MRTGEHDRIAANCVPEVTSHVGLRSGFSAQIVEVVVEHLDPIASELV